MLQERMMIVDNETKNQKGISLISLIITIIVIIFLISIVVFNGIGATESAGFAKFAQEFSGHEEEIQQKILKEKEKNLLKGVIKSDSEIYKSLSSGDEIDIEKFISQGLPPETLKGEKCYRLSGDMYLYNAYITDKGEVFTWPGYRYVINGEERYYVNAGKYYTGETVKINGGAPIVEMGELKIGDYVKYIPDVATYTIDDFPQGKNPSDYYTGLSEEDVNYDYYGCGIATDTTLKWRVLDIGADGTVTIASIDDTLSNVGNSERQMTLYGIPGYINSERILNYACEKLYSNNNLGIKARNLMLEDYCRIFIINSDTTVQDYIEWVESTTTISQEEREEVESLLPQFLQSLNLSVAYYPADATNTPDVIINGVTYKGMACVTESNQEARFLEFVSGTSTKCLRTDTIVLGDEKEFTYTYATPTVEDGVVYPVLVGSGRLAGGVPKNEDMVFDVYRWVVNKEKELSEGIAKYGIRKIEGNFIGAFLLHRSDSDNPRKPEVYPSIFPVITLDANYKLTTEDVTTAGSEANPWTISKAK